MFLLSCKQGQRIDHKNLIIFKATTFFKVVALFFSIFFVLFSLVIANFANRNYILIKIYL
ncbi:MAG: hypothetical protein EGR08_02465 [Prevotella sp.]|nr:hypothetical protein [Prevotella sp.]